MNQTRPEKGESTVTGASDNGYCKQVNSRHVNTEKPTRLGYLEIARLAGRLVTR